MACTTENQSDLQVVFGDVTLGVCSGQTKYIFSYDAGGLVSLVKSGREWIYRFPRPAFWRATTDNDRGSRFSLGSAMWMGADQFVGKGEIHVFLDGKEQTGFRAPDNNQYRGVVCAEKIAISFTYLTPTVPQTKVTVEYTILGGGQMQVRVHYYGKEGLPQLPAFGLRFLMPTAASGYAWDGLSGETYPDRMAGAVRGHFEEKGLPVTPYLVPQDCGVHMQTERLVVTRESVLANEIADPGTFSLTFEQLDAPFAFSCLPYTPLELESATHIEELPPARRTVVTILGAVRGVGGIDSWGTNVEDAYHIPAEKDITFGVVIR